MQETDLRLITCGRLADEFKAFINSQYPRIDIKRVRKEELHKTIEWANAYAGFYELEGLDVSHLKWIHSFGAGVDSFLENESIVANKIPISRSVGNMGRSIAAYCLAFVLAHYQQVFKYREQQQAHEWKPLPSKSITASNILVLGTGGIAQQIAEVFKRLGCYVVGVNTTGKSVMSFDQCISLSELKTHAASTDVIINALPLTDQTSQLLSDDFFQNFNEAIFINVGRGKTVDTDALIKALENGCITQAILDVFDKEPLPSDSALWNHPSILITPHVSGLSTIDDIKSGFKEGLTALKKGDHEIFINHEKGY